MGVERVEGAHEGVVGEEAGVLPVQQQGEPVSLVAVAAVIAAQGQVKAEDQEKSEPAGRSESSGNDRGSFLGHPGMFLPDARNWKKGRGVDGGSVPGCSVPVNVSSR